MLPTKFRFIWPSGFRGEDLKKSTNQKQELHADPAIVLSRFMLSFILCDSVWSVLL